MPLIFISVKDSKCLFCDLDFYGVLSPLTVYTVLLLPWKPAVVGFHADDCGLCGLSKKYSKFLVLFFFFFALGCLDLQLSLLNPETWTAQVYDWPPVR